MKKFDYHTIPQLCRLGGTDSDGVLAHSVKEVLFARDRDFLPEQIFYMGPFAEDTAHVLTSCRFVARGPEDLLQLEQIASQTQFEGVIRAGLRLQAEGFGIKDKAVEPAALKEIASQVKALPHLTLRGCFFCGDLNGVHGKTLGRFFRAGYETAKQMTVIVPCAMPYICYEGALEAIETNAKEHPETLNDCINAVQIMAMQNETAFYAKLWIG